MLSRRAPYGGGLIGLPGLPMAADAELFEFVNRVGVQVTGLQGSGLGLPLCRALMEEMGGSIGLHDRPRRDVVVDLGFPSSGTLRVIVGRT